MKSIGGMMIGVTCAFAASFAWARTGTVTVTKDGETFNLTFADHAHETNGLWAVWDSVDRGQGTNGWENVRYLGTVSPETNSWAVAVPEGWGETVTAWRAVLSEVPYDVDCTLDFLRNSRKNRIVLADFDFKGSYRLVMRCRRVSCSATASPAMFTTRAVNGNAAPYFNLFEIYGSSWRFDYKDEIGTNVKSSLLKDGATLDIDCSYKNLIVNGGTVNSRSSQADYFNGTTNGRLEFFCGNTTAETMSNSDHTLDLFGAQIYDYLDEKGNEKSEQKLLVDLVPALKDGVAGLYDAVRGVFYTTDSAYPFDTTVPTRRESEQPFFASARFVEPKDGATYFEIEQPTTYAESFSNPKGGYMVGSSVLTLSGTNDWGGRFVVSNGTVVAGFGQGIGANDNLALIDSDRTESYYGGWNGVATNAWGAGPGRISAGGRFGYYRYSAVAGDLCVNVGGEGTAIKPSSMLRLALNAEDDHTLTFENPIQLADGLTVVLRSICGKSVFTGGITAAHPDVDSTVSVYGNPAGVNPAGQFTFAGATNDLYRLSIYNGGLTLASNTVTTVHNIVDYQDGVFTLDGGTLDMNGSTGKSDIYIKGNAANFRSGTVKASSLVIGQSSSSTAVQSGQLAVSCKVTLTAGYGGGSGYGTPEIRDLAGGSALTLETNAWMEVQNFRFKRRNLRVNGGLLRMNGGQGIIDMGQYGATRLWLNGGRLETPSIRQYDPSANAGDALVVFNGGTLAVTKAATWDGNGVLFQNFEPTSYIGVQGQRGGVIETDYEVSITNVLRWGNSAGSDVMDAWNYTAADYLTAPALVKSGKGVLTLTETNSYLCATDVAAGTLRLSGANAALPAEGVVRVTGGTLDLGGKVQRLKALCGTAGMVKNGSVTVTEGIYPGGAGEVGSFACEAALAGALYIDVDAAGAADSLLTTTALDLSNLDLVVTAPATAPEVLRRLKIVNGSYAGTFKSVIGLPNGWTLHYADGCVTIGPDRGLMIILR